jgi:large subunit ribosomal protein L19
MGLFIKHQNTEFKVGDTVKVYQRLVEGEKERIQTFEGVVIKIHGNTGEKTFTVRKISGGIGVERIYPIDSPFIQKIEVVKQGHVRRAKLYYLRDRTGRLALKVKTKYDTRQTQEETEPVEEPNSETEPEETRSEPAKEETGKAGGAESKETATK